MRWSLGLCLLLVAGGCERDQPWTFHNGTGLDDERPPLIIAEVYSGGECGFACQPPGNRVYCADLAGRAEAPAPTNLMDGERYCFMGTAIDARGQAFAVGCTVAEVGGDPIDVALSPIEDGRVIIRQCELPPVVMIDGGPGGLDAGPGPADAGPGGVDAGPRDAGVDAGPGLPQGTPVRVYFDVEGPGQVSLYDSDGSLIGGEPLQNGWRLWIDAWVGFYVRVESRPDPDASLTRLDPPGCGLATSCEFTFVDNATYVIAFSN